MIDKSFIQYLVIAFPASQVQFIANSDLGWVRIIIRRHSEKLNRMVEVVRCVSYGMLTARSIWPTEASLFRSQFERMEESDEETGGTEGVRSVCEGADTGS